MTYWMLNAIFLAVVLAVVIATLLERRSPRWSSLALVMVIVLLMTALFDNIMIGVGLVGYDETRISGVFVGIAPLKDFAYAVAAVVLLPTLWTLLGRRASAVDRAQAKLSTSTSTSTSTNARTNPSGGSDG